MIWKNTVNQLPRIPLLSQRIFGYLPPGSFCHSRRVYLGMYFRRLKWARLCKRSHDNELAEHLGLTHEFTLLQVIYYSWAMERQSDLADNNHQLLKRGLLLIIAVGADTNAMNTWELWPCTYRMWTSTLNLHQFPLSALDILMIHKPHSMPPW